MAKWLNELRLLWGHQLLWLKREKRFINDFNDGGKTSKPNKQPNGQMTLGPLKSSGVYGVYARYIMYSLMLKEL
ncbi:hypothetical protein DERP_009179 [Dermatophagoides pteronyssinus]|uniref:Uncharacterized protein n=1 Tax=Dermatophagoides pteronyssinus TaxID=6956 RepID=A0ABQ8JQS1_DERPT|nr:hypothetical protein DERP_009179 [Dermatophagoides pteronyssinus]